MLTTFKKQSNKVRVENPPNTSLVTSSTNAAGNRSSSKVFAYTARVGAEQDPSAELYNDSRVNRRTIRNPRTDFRQQIQLSPTPITRARVSRSPPNPTLTPFPTRSRIAISPPSISRTNTFKTRVVERVSERVVEQRVAERVAETVVDYVQSFSPIIKQSPMGKSRRSVKVMSKRSSPAEKPLSPRRSTESTLSESDQSPNMSEFEQSPNVSESDQSTNASDFDQSPATGSLRESTSSLQKSTNESNENTRRTVDVNGSPPVNSRHIARPSNSPEFGELIAGTDHSRPSIRRHKRISTLGEVAIDVAKTERMNRNTDSVLEDTMIAKFLKIRLKIRWEQVTRRTIRNFNSSDFAAFALSELDTGKPCLDAASSALITEEKRENAANIAIAALMDGYFKERLDKNVDNAKRMFRDNLRREQFHKNEYICRQGALGERLYVIEEGVVSFIVNGQLAGAANNGAVFGELSLVYGLPRQADVVAKSDIIAWSIDSLGFRRIQALVARESLMVSKSNILKRVGKQASSLVEEQEEILPTINAVAFDEVTRICVVGQGTFGSVYIASVKSRPNESFALKRMSKSSIVERENEKRVLIEKNALQSMIGCPFIITISGTFQDKDNVYFLTECVQGGDLISYMIEKDQLCHEDVVFYTFNIAAALAHVHSKGYIHRDVKPENCLIDKDGYIKLCDFGLSKRLPSTVILPNGGTEVVRLAFTMCGTPEFMAPEFVLSTGYDKSVDWWALGCILVEMYTGMGPFDFDGDLKKTFKYVCLIGMGRKRFDLPKRFLQRGMEDAAGIASALLSFAKTRLGGVRSDDVLCHKYFASIVRDDFYKKTANVPYRPTVDGVKDSSNFKLTHEGAKFVDETPEYDGEQDWCDGF